MATRLIYLCELCLDAGVETPATPVYLMVDDGGGVVDLCTDHEAAVVAPVRALILGNSRPAPGPAEARKSRRSPKRAEASASVPLPRALTPGVEVAAGWPCPACPGRTPVTTASGLAYHAEKQHGVKVSDINAMVRHCRMPGCEWGGTEYGHAVAKHVATVHRVPNLAAMTVLLAATDPERVEDLMSVWLGTQLVSV